MHEFIDGGVRKLLMLFQMKQKVRRGMKRNKGAEIVRARRDTGQGDDRRINRVLSVSYAEMSCPTVVQCRTLSDNFRQVEPNSTSEK